jgi:hypothetical protein
VYVQVCMNACITSTCHDTQDALSMISGMWEDGCRMCQLLTDCGFQHRQTEDAELDTYQVCVGDM